ncbi:MAG: hypothetical protein RL220_1307 [Bacteroidota bacterium]|jgi:hypothetical protein
MDSVIQFFEKAWEVNPGYFLLGGFIFLIGIVGKWRLFVKANQPGLAAIVPVWDVLVTLRLVGRPASHLAYLLVPGYNIYFLFRLLIEVAQSYGKYTIVDYVMVCLFNVFYVLNLGLAYNEYYYGPVYGMDFKDVQARKEPVLA